MGQTESTQPVSARPPRHEVVTCSTQTDLTTMQLTCNQTCTVKEAMAESNTKEISLADSLGTVLESEDGADVILVVGGSELPAHSQILAARSSVFAATLRHDMREARSCRIEIADMGEAVMKQLLQFIYTDKAPQMDRMAAELLFASDKYDLPVLKKRCEQAMARDLTVDNAATTAALAELHSCPLLKSAAVEFIAGHPQVMATEGWRNVLLPKVKVAAEICSAIASVASSSSSQSYLSEIQSRQMRFIEMDDYCH